MDINYETYLDQWCSHVDFWEDWFHEITTDINIIDILSGLQFIHNLNQVHRDLKPANGIHLCYNWLKTQYWSSSLGCQWQLKIADFGFTAVAESGTMNVSLQGRMTPIYCAPELLITNRFSKKSDIWAFGCILYEWALCCLNRRRAFSAITEITSYYFDETIAPPQISWEDLEITPHCIPMKRRPYRELVEQQWDHLNRIFQSIFKRDPEERPSAATLIEQLTLFNQNRRKHPRLL